MDNRREFYRLDLFGEEEIIVIHSGGKDKGRILDISATGLGFEANYEFEFTTAVLQFELNKEKFQRQAKLIRKKNLISGKTFYAVNFFNFAEKERQHLFQTLMKLDARKRLGRGD